ncbi:MAG: sulfotransferase [Xanthomonadales bacterium]|nr:sulfotransferase [Xanthomonadales bacterium]
MSTVHETRDENLRAVVRAMKANRPLRAEELCRDYLEEHPGCVEHLRLLSHALTKQNRLQEAEEQLRFALELRPAQPHLHEDLGTNLALQGRPREAVPCFEKAIELDPTLPLPHKKLGRVLAALGQGAEADSAFQEYFERDPDKGAVAIGADHLKAGRTDEAVDTLKAVLKKDPNNVDAMVFLALAYRQLDNHMDDAEALLRRATQAAPDHVTAWLNLGSILAKRNKRPEALEAYRQATRIEPGHPGAWSLMANCQAHLGDTEAARHSFERSLKLKPDHAHTQMGYGHVLKTLGDQDAALRAYREAIRLRPSSGEVYWSMANLKIFHFEDSEVDAMLGQLDRGQLQPSEAVHFHFALGKAFEDQKDWERAWHHFHTGNQKQRTEVYHDPLEDREKKEAIRNVFSESFIAEHEGGGFEAPDPILVVGLPRSGSTLVEQILASHSQVEGTAELPNLGRLSMSIGRYRPDGVQFPEACADLRARDWRQLGKRYIEETRRYRVTDRPYFTDKLPNNFPLIGLLHLILPNAKVINTLRHPLDTLLGNYKQLYGQGQNFTYDLFDLAEYYKDYHAMMAHWRAVLPGKVLDVHYEDTVLDTETQVRRLLDHCGLPFEEACLRPWETERAVRTASSEQVRQPIYTGALGKWRRYEPWLDVWKDSLADILDDLPPRVRDAGRPAD